MTDHPNQPSPPEPVGEIPPPPADDEPQRHDESEQRGKRKPTESRAHREAPARSRARRPVSITAGAVVLCVTLWGGAFWGVSPETLTSRYGEPVPSSAAAAVRFLEAGGRAIRDTDEGERLAVTLTEEEASSAFSLGLMLPRLRALVEPIPHDELRAEQSFEALHDRIWEAHVAMRDSASAARSVPARMLAMLAPRARMREVQVRFEDSGEVVAAGYLELWGVDLPLLLAVIPSARGGALELAYVRGRAGRLPVPGVFFGLVRDAVSRAAMTGGSGAEIAEIVVGQGSLTVVGSFR